MTKFNNNYVPSTPKTYEVKYVDLKEPSKISQIASYLGVKTAECCSSCGVSDKKFKITMNLRNAGGGHIEKTVNDVDTAATEASNIISGTKGWEGTINTGVFRAKNRNNLAAKINAAIKEHTKDKGAVYIGTETNDVDKNDK